MMQLLKNPSIDGNFKLPIDIDWLLSLLKNEYKNCNFETMELILVLLSEILETK